MKITPEQATVRLAKLPGWTLENDAITKEFVFKDFAQAIGFMTATATAAEKLNHHPEWSNVYNKVTVRLTTHDVSGLSELDFQLGRRMNELAN